MLQEYLQAYFTICKRSVKKKLYLHLSQKYFNRNGQQSRSEAVVFRLKVVSKKNSCSTIYPKFTCFFLIYTANSTLIDQYIYMERATFGMKVLGCINIHLDTP